MVSPFIQPATKDKIKFLNGRKRAEMLSENVPKKVVTYGLATISQPNISVMLHCKLTDMSLNKHLQHRDVFLNSLFTRKIFK